MPREPDGQRRPGDVVGCAVAVAKIATGETEEAKPSFGRSGGLVGGPARAKTLSPEQRSEIARKAAIVRWDGGSQESRRRPA